MKKHAQIVIGLSYGDEGKGVVTDFLSFLNPNSIVVRFSGGQQAGHTVMRDGIKHIHSSYGSGTLQGLQTYLSEYTTFYLPSIEKERNVLLEKGIIPQPIFIHPLAAMTTPYDVAFNKYKETRLSKHGSCGLGVGATMDRNISTPYKLYAIDLLNKKLLKQKLDNILDYYHEKISIELRDDYYSILEREIDTESFMSLIDNKDLLQIIDYKALGSNIIFEGSQGIMLDMNHGVFPHVTYANTTSKNAIKLCKKLKLQPELYYVTRCYQTRHGRGPMTSKQEIELINNEEEINVVNLYQGKFRIAEIDYEQLEYSLDVDSIYSGKNWERKNLVVTCLDQRPNFTFNSNRFKSRVSKILYNNSPIAGNIQHEFARI
jgi:adenylosuccinate synthase